MRGRASPRRGSALLIALALLALAAALLAGSTQTGRSAARSAQSHATAIAADAEARAALAEFVSGMPATADSLGVGQGITATLGPRNLGASGMIAATRIRLLRVSSRRYVVGLEVTVGPAGITAARRRMWLIMEQEAPPDTSSVRPARQPIAQWSLADLF